MSHNLGFNEETSSLLSPAHSESEAESEPALAQTVRAVEISSPSSLFEPCLQAAQAGSALVTPMDLERSSTSDGLNLPKQIYKCQSYRSKSAGQFNSSNSSQSDGNLGMQQKPEQMDYDTGSDDLELLAILNKNSREDIKILNDNNDSNDSTKNETNDNNDNDDNNASNGSDNDNNDNDNDNDNDSNSNGTDNDSEDEVDTPMASFLYLNENQAEYRPGGYHPVSVGDCFQQRYYALNKLGWGHYSTVWLCFDIKLERYCAIKLVKSAELYADAARHEIQLLRHISELNWHPMRHRLVNLTDHFSTSGVNGTHQCLVFDVLGDNMLMLIQRSNYQGLPLYNVKQIAFQVLQGLYLLHEQSKLIHTDLKPENVLLVTDDVAVRTQANAASKKYLKDHFENSNHNHNISSSSSSSREDDVKLSKTAKRRLRTKTKQTVGFFQGHRKWLRQRGVSDLLILAQRHMLSAKMALDAVTGNLPFMSFDSPCILSEEDVVQFNQQDGMFLEEVGDTEQHNSNSMALKLLQDDTEKFMRYVQTCIEKEQKEETQSNVKRSSRKKQSFRKKSRQSLQDDCQPYSQEPNLTLIKCPDPALEPCRITIAIADVGNSCFINNHVTEDIQTREYRAVEVILGAGYDTSADLWSAACLFWELATGEYLFEPNKWRGTASQDEVHIAHIIETCGEIPMELIRRGEFSDEIFSPDGKLLHIKTLSTRPLEDILIDRYHWSVAEAKHFVNFLMPMLHTNPSKRVSARLALNHSWLNLFDKPEETNMSQDSTNSLN